ncbi:MAG: ABC transporter substrate-binding protein [Oscillospiraceae bacterium]|nr:ABC transporter substrate-binding protein [Oscillospiraceae bacterium]
MKKILALCVALTLLLALAACGESESTESSASETSTSESASANTGLKDTYNIAIVKQMDHASMDEIAAAITAELDTIAKENDITIEYNVYSGQGDESVLTQIGEQAVQEGVDAIIPIATLAAQVMVSCAEGHDIPVIYAAVSDPAGADLEGIDYVTGTSDALDTEYILEMMSMVNPELEKVGLLYSKSEDNSTAAIEEAKNYLDNEGIEYVEATAASTTDEVIQAVSTLIADDVQAIFTPTDNIIMSAELAIYEQLIEAGIPHYTGADSFVRNGAFITCGVNYTDLGTETADLAFQAITEGMSDLEDCYKVAGGIITVNTETAEALGLKYDMFEDKEIVEVVTTED